MRRRLIEQVYIEQHNYEKAIAYNIEGLKLSVASKDLIAIKNCINKNGLKPF